MVRSLDTSPLTSARLAPHSQRNFRYDLTKYLPFGDRTGIAAVVHANNLTNQVIWLPSGFSSVDTVPVQQGRDIFAGLEFYLGNK